MRTTWAFGSLCLLACGGSSSGGGGDDDPATYHPPYESCAGAPAATPPPSGSLCLVDPASPPTAPPFAVIEHEFLQYNGVDAIHLDVVFDPKFVDNTYGTSAIGWSRSHTFKDLVGSDHAEIKVLDAKGTVVLDFNLDYISADPKAPCKFSCLGVDGGEGKMLLGDRKAILGWSSSLDRNLNERGYCSYVTNSPPTDANCTPNPAAPNWDFRVVYEVWIAASAFSATPFGSAYMSFVHASPSKLADNTVTVQPGECPCVEIDINSCEPPPPGNPGAPCTTNPECPTESFCYDMHCVPIVL